MLETGAGVEITHLTVDVRQTPRHPHLSVPLLYVVNHDVGVHEVHERSYDDRGATPSTTRPKSI